MYKLKIYNNWIENLRILYRITFGFDTIRFFKETDISILTLDKTKVSLDTIEMNDYYKKDVINNKNRLLHFGFLLQGCFLTAQNTETIFIFIKNVTNQHNIFMS